MSGFIMNQSEQHQSPSFLNTFHADHSHHSSDDVSDHTTTAMGSAMTTMTRYLGLPRRRKMDLSLVFLIWLCITLVLSPLEGDAREVDAPEGVNRVGQFDQYFRGSIQCTVKGGECCNPMTSIGCQGWFCIERVCSVLSCEYCPKEDGDPYWFCGAVEGVTKHGGMACKRKALEYQPCDNVTMPCGGGLVCSSVNNTCQYTPELWKQHEEEVRSRRVTMAGMIIILVAMFLAMRRMLKNEDTRRRQIWEPVDSSAEASILQRLADDTQRRVAGGWGQISGTLVEGGNAATAAVGTAFSRIRDNVRNATSGNRAPDDCDDTMEMLPNGRRTQTRRELEADMRDFLLEGDDDEDDEDEHAWDQVRDDDGLLAHHNTSSRSSGSTMAGSRPVASSSASTSSASGTTNGNTEGYPDEPPAYDEVRANGQSPPSLYAGLQPPASSSTGTRGA
ncbi:hypothetical protein BGZ94_008728 [Podila epigama]|nr:hypothetical protein BGZ94_008728 [Podila epigama]